MRQVFGAQNPRIAELRRLIGRRSSRSATILLEGPRTVREALEAGFEPTTVVVPESHADDGAVGSVEARVGAAVEWLVVRDHVFEKLAPAATPQPMLALVPRPAASLPAVLADDAVVLVLVEVGDPGNVGTLIRAADAVAATAVVVVGGADPWGPKAVRSSAGSVLRTPVIQYADLADATDALRAAGARVVGTDVAGGDAHDGGVLESPVAIVLGSEAHGLDDGVEVDAWCHIAMPGRTESLNVAMAGTLLLYEARREARTAGD